MVVASAHFRFTLRSRGFPVLAALCLVGSVAAAEPAEEPAEEVIEVRAPRPTRAADQPAAMVTVIEVRDLGAGALTADALGRAAPAARLKDFGGPGQPMLIGLRGAAPHQTALRLDGVTLPDLVGSGVDLAAWPVALVERMEVVRGAASLLAGSGALGGSIELVTPEVRRPTWFARLSSGSFGTWQLAAGAAAADERSRFLVAGAGLQTRGDFVFLDDRNTPANPYDDVERRRENNDARQGALLWKADSRLGALRLRLTGATVALERGVAGLLGFCAHRAREANWAALVDGRLQLDLTTVQLEIGADLAADGRRFRDPLGELTGVEIDARQEGTRLGGHLGTLVDLGAGRLLRARLEAGGEMWRDRALDNPDRSHQAAVVAGELPLAGERFRLSPGLRLERFSDAGWQWAPALGAAGELGDGLSWQAAVARAYRVPAFGELYLEGGYAVGNPELRPETAWSADMGLRWRSPWRIEWAAAGFWSRYTDLIVYEPTANFRYRPRNAAAAEIGGLELEVGGEPGGGVRLAGHYTLLWSADRSGASNADGRELPGRPRHNAGLRFSGRWGPVLASADATYVGANYVNQANTKSLSARWLLGAGLGVAPSRGLSVMLELRNLLDDQVQDVRGLPLPGFSFFLTVSASQPEAQEGERE